MNPYYVDDTITLHYGDALEVLAQLPDASVNCIVTSPPYFGLRDYGVKPTHWPEVNYAPMPGFPSITIPPMSCALGTEADPAAFVAHLTLLFAEARRVLHDDGTLWLNLGDSYASKARGSDAGWDKSRLTNPGGTQKAQAASLRKTGERHRGKAAGIAEKNMFGIPWRVAFALQADGWTVRNDVIWAKTNGMPESVTDRLSSKHEHLFMLAKNSRYWFDLDPVREPHTMRPQRRPSGRPQDETPRPEGQPKQSWSTAARTDVGVDGHPGGRNPGDVWTIPTQPFAAAHFATMAPALAERCVLAGCRPDGVVLDPFSGSGTTGWAAVKHGRRYVGIDLNETYLDMSLQTRLAQGAFDFGGAA